MVSVRTSSWISYVPNCATKGPTWPRVALGWPFRSPSPPALDVLRFPNDREMFFGKDDVPGVRLVDGAPRVLLLDHPPDSLNGRAGYIGSKQACGDNGHEGERICVHEVQLLDGS